GAGSLANEHIKSLALDYGLARLDTPVLTNAPVLERINHDIVRNLEVFRDSEREETDLRRLRFRVGLSIQLAVRRGFTENQLAAAGELRERGVTLRKMWLANFHNNTPCPCCSALHGQEIPLGAEFPHGDDKDPKTYSGLRGPPRHPN